MLLCGMSGSSWFLFGGRAGQAPPDIEQCERKRRELMRELSWLLEKPKASVVPPTGNSPCVDFPCIGFTWGDFPYAMSRFSLQGVEAGRAAVVGMDGDCACPVTAALAANDKALTGEALIDEALSLRSELVRGVDVFEPICASKDGSNLLASTTTRDASISRSNSGSGQEASCPCVSGPLPGAGHGKPVTVTAYVLSVFVPSASTAQECLYPVASAAIPTVKAFSRSSSAGGPPGPGLSRLAHKGNPR